MATTAARQMDIYKSSIFAFPLNRFMDSAKEKIAMRRMIWVVSLLFILQNPLFADTVTLRDGRVLHGKITENKKHAREIKMDVYYESMTIPNSAILSIEEEEKSVSSSPGQVTRVEKGNSPRAPLPSNPEQLKAMQKKQFPKEIPPQETILVPSSSGL